LLSGSFGTMMGPVPGILLILLLSGVFWWILSRPVIPGKRAALAGITAGSLMLGLVMLPWYALVEPEKILPAYFSPAAVSFVFTTGILTPFLAVLSATFLFRAGLAFLPGKERAGEKNQARSGSSRRTAAILFLLTGLILGKSIYNLYWQAVWDSTTDSLDYFLLIPPAFSLVFSGLFLTAVLPWKAKWAGLGFMILMPLLLFSVFNSGKQVDPRQLTRERADRVAGSLEKYHLKEGVYPEDLSRLTPGYLLSIPDPVIISGQTWCYVGGPDGYQLGAVDRDHWSSPLIFGRLLRSQGNANSTGELCAREIRAIQAHQPQYYGLR